MNNRKPTYKTAAKKRNANLLRRVKQKQLHANNRMKKSSLHLPVNRKKPKYLRQPPSTWKLPAAFLFTGLLLFILAVPTLIVLPFGEEKDAAGTVVEEQQKAETVDLGASPFSVAVMRSTSETVDNVPLEEYVARVVASEMPAEFEVEALKAQALAARTYIVNHKLYQDNSGEFDVTDTTQHQVYKDEQQLRQTMDEDYTEHMNKVKQAVAATKGEILTYNSAPITPAFFSTSNGYTENSEDYWQNELPYLRSVESPWDKQSPKFLDQQVVSLKEAEEALEIDLPDDGAVAMELTRTESQRVDQLKIAGSTFSGRDVRERLGLQSSDFTIEQKNDHLIFTTKGFGHGIGMSQYGANGMAKKGKTYKEIVKHYYQDVSISTVDDTAPTLVAR
ncbi:stage II sporulation protein D [Lentibacillus sediminis]|uniref:stage II sporulation protein D n=1 Tax=Lentibacillus sediminis TaxID=1940529 RepID=UPI001EFE11A4|nr:stage II sporulation protein D [Lentibacillus sediminis]